MHFSIDRTVHTTAFDKPVVDHWLERKIAQTAAGSTEKDRSDDRPLQRRARYRLSYIPLLTSVMINTTYITNDMINITFVTNEMTTVTLETTEMKITFITNDTMAMLAHYGCNQ